MEDRILDSKGELSEWFIDVPLDIWLIIEGLHEDPKMLTIDDAIEWGEWIMEQSTGETFYNDEDDDEPDVGVQEVREWLAKYNK